MNREIITLQIGHLANYVGTSLWNHFDLEERQENHRIDFNNYFTFNPKTNMPTARVLIIDYHNAFGNLLEETTTTSNDSSMEIIQRSASNQFWSKELRTRAQFHPKSLIPLVDQWCSPNDEENHFDLYAVGRNTFKKTFDRIESSFHFLLESCDSLQSFRCLYDVNNSFSGLFSSIEDYLAVECPKRPIWSFALSDRQSSPLNRCFTFVHSLLENQTPTIPCLNLTDRCDLALAIQHSLFSPPVPLDLLADRLCPMKMNLLNFNWKIPFDLHGKTFYQHLETMTTPILSMENPLACHCFIRGIGSNQLINSSLHRLNFADAAELFDVFLREKFGEKFFPSTSSWNEVLHGKIGMKTFDSIALFTALINDQKKSENFLTKLNDELKKINVKTLSKRWQENDFDEQTFEQLQHDLNSLEEQYQSD